MCRAAACRPAPAATTAADRLYSSCRSRLEHIRPQALTTGVVQTEFIMGKPEGLCCAVPVSKSRVVEVSASAGRVRSIRSFEKKWINGSVLKYHFLEAFANGSDWEDFKALVREGFATWKAQGLGLTFEETSDLQTAQIRIGFLQGDGSWSYVGRDVLTIPLPRRTMNFGWNLRGDPDTVIHEIGHTLGLQHEHQNPNAGAGPQQR